ncbi:HNH endonuclease [Yersinia enterocolitica]|nr:HNH endonuclease [Yersinia enterocolitica]EKN6084593.1 hypothetical protein [Yersinia enterocolitica]
MYTLPAVQQWVFRNLGGYEHARRPITHDLSSFVVAHHIKPLHTIGENYVVDSVTDMIPLCPNCHAMVHRGSEVLLVEELKKKMRFWSE